MTAARRILLVDDAPDDRALAATVLRGRLDGIEVHEVADGLAFATRLARGDFDAAVVEQHLAWADGLRLLSTIKDFYPDRPVVLFTGDPDPDLASRAIQAGADGYATKSSRGYLRLAEVVEELLGWPAATIARHRPPAEALSGGSEHSPTGRPGGDGPGQSDDRIGDLSRAVTHDLQEPLQLVTRYAGLIDERFRDRLGEEGTRFLGHLTASARRMQEMIDDLHDLLRLDAGTATAEPVALDEVVDEALETLRGAIEESGARIDRGPLPTVPADRRQMVRLFQNLLGNAIKFRGEAAPEIRIGAERRDGAWAISVRDNGIGIAPADQQRIFQMFQRLHTADEVPGSGVGLAVSRRIAEGHGGSLDVESTPGAGSTFTLTLSLEGAS